MLHRFMRPSFDSHLPHFGPRRSSYMAPMRPFFGPHRRPYLGHANRFSFLPYGRPNLNPQDSHHDGPQFCPGPPMNPCGPCPDPRCSHPGPRGPHPGPRGPHPGPRGPHHGPRGHHPGPRGPHHFPPPPSDPFHGFLPCPFPGPHLNFNPVFGNQHPCPMGPYGPFAPSSMEFMHNIMNETGSFEEEKEPENHKKENNDCNSQNPEDDMDEVEKQNEGPHEDHQDSESRDMNCHETFDCSPTGPCFWTAVDDGMWSVELDAFPFSGKEVTVKVKEGEGVLVSAEHCHENCTVASMSRLLKPPPTNLPFSTVHTFTSDGKVVITAQVDNNLTDEIVHE